MNKRIKFILFILLLVGCFYVPNTINVLADDCKDACKTTYQNDKNAKDECEDNCELIEKNEKKAEEYQKIIDTETKKQTTFSNQLDYIANQQNTNQRNLNSTIKDINDLADKIKQLEKDVKEKEKEIVYQKKLLSVLMQSYYDYNQQGILGLVLLNENVANTFEKTDYIEQSGMKASEVLSEIKETQRKLIKDQEELRDSQEESVKLKDKLQDEKYKLQVTENQKKSLLAETTAKKEKYEELLRSIEREIYELESGKSVDYGNIPAAKGGYFDYPVSSPVVTQNYGCLRDSFARRSYPSCDGGKGGFHNGIDFGKNSGSTIYAVKSGKIIGSGNNGNYAYGQWIAIDHGDGLVSLYGHLSSKYVSKGEKVKSGEKIGKMGTTGYSTGIHLHFSVFDKKSFGTIESKYINGLMIPTGASISPKRYLK